jgi:hypothetical protein
VDRDPLKPTRSGPPDPPPGKEAEQRPYGLGERSPLDPSPTPMADTLRSSDRPLRVVPPPQSAGPQLEAPPLPSRGAVGSGQPSLKRLRRELEVTREEIRHLHEMTLELPKIFEDKFRQRLRETLRQQQLLMEETTSLRRMLLELGSAANHGPRPPLLLPPARTERFEPVEPLARTGLMQSLREAWGGLAGGQASKTLSGDEPTRDGLADPIHK